MLLSDLQESQEGLTYAALNDQVISYYVNNAGIVSSSSVYTHNLPKTNLIDYWKIFKYHSNDNNSLVPFGNPPPGLLYANAQTIIFERPPTTKVVTWTGNMLDEIDNNSEYTSFEIPIPWQVYFVHFTPSEDGANIISHIYMAFAKSQVNSDDQVLYQPPLSNFYTHGKLCTPNYETYAEISEGTETISGIMQNAYNQVWDSKSNNDLTASFISFQRHFATPFCYPHDTRNIRFRTISDANIFDNTVARNMSESNKAVDTLSNTYYTNSTYPYYFYESWSQIPIQEICDLDWAPLDVAPNDSSVYYDAIEKVSTPAFKEYYQNATGIDLTPYLSYRNDECCDDCSGYDEDYESGYCSEEDCNCHAPSFNVPHKLWYNKDTDSTYFYNYFNEIGLLPKPDKTVIDVYNNMIRDIAASSGNGLLNMNQRLLRKDRRNAKLSSEIATFASLNS